MKSEIRIVEGTYAVLRNNVVIGVVDRYSDSGWQFFPLVEGDGDTVHPVRLSYALKQAMGFEPRG